ncbi:MAG: (2Fe-2S)-binding protein [Bilifractor sp.]|jgi:NAD(P)H-nitrite reductase large subunit
MDREWLNRKYDGAPFIAKLDDDLIICRCEEITKGEIRKAVHDGMYTLDEVKRFLRPGMGPCQGMTCSRNVKGIVAAELGVSPDSLDESRPRAPQRPVVIAEFGKESEEGGGV